MKTPKKPVGKTNGKVAGGAKKAGINPVASEPAKRLDDDDDEFDEPLDDVDFDSLNNLDDDDY